MTDRTLIRGGTVLTMDRSVGNLRSGDVLIEDGAVAEIGESIRVRNAEVVDAADCIVMPGFVDAHRHVAHALFRNAGRELSSVNLAGPDGHYPPEHLYAATLVGLLGAVEAGITTVVDWVEVPPQAEFLEAAFQAHRDAGGRTVLVAAAPERGGDHGGPASVARLVDGVSGTTGVAYGSDAPTPDAIDALPDAWRAARAAGLRIHAHAGTAASRGVIATLAGEGVLGDSVTLVHCTNLGDGDFDVVSTTSTQVVVTPAMEMTDGLGRPPLQALIDRGIRPGLGVGSEIEAPGDMFAQMRAANSVQHATIFDLKLAGKGGVPNLLTTRDVIRFGTIDGAVAAGLGDVTGSLTPGKRADIIVLRADRPNIAPVNDPIGAVVWGMDTSNLDWVFVDGRVLMREGVLLSDVAAARRLAAAAHREVAAAVGRRIDSGAPGP